MLPWLLFLGMTEADIPGLDRDDDQINKSIASKGRSHYSGPYLHVTNCTEGHYQVREGNWSVGSVPIQNKLKKWIYV